MRVFFALTFNDKDKKKITKYRDMIANRALKGRFTRESNYHLTLEFIGEVTHKEVDDLCEILHEVYYKTKEKSGIPSELKVEYIGSFKRRDREILWLGLESNKLLIRLHKFLVKKLKAEAFIVDERKYTPHITIGRQVLIEEAVNDIMIEPIVMEIKGFALMESKNVDGVLVYVPIEEIEIA